MNPVYTCQQLEAKKRPQLWAICETLGLPRHASNAKCVEVILEIQPAKVKTETVITTESVNDPTVVYANNNPIVTITYQKVKIAFCKYLLQSSCIYLLGTNGFWTYIHKYGMNSLQKFIDSVTASISKPRATST